MLQIMILRAIGSVVEGFELIQVAISSVLMVSLVLLVSLVFSLFLHLMSNYSIPIKLCSFQYISIWLPVWYNTVRQSVRSITSYLVRGT